MRQRRWMELLHEYDFTIKYQPGKENAVADALSRKSLAATITLVQTSLEEEIRQGCIDDPFFIRITTILTKGRKLEKESRTTKGFHLEQGILYFHNRVYIPANKELKAKILYEAHDSPIAAHPSYIKTYTSLRRSFY